MVLSHDMIVVDERATEKLQHVFKDGDILTFERLKITLN